MTVAEMHIRIRKGLDIPLSGRPEMRVEPGGAVATVALLGDDYCGLKPKVLVSTGQHVALGEPLFIDKRDPAVAYTAPGSGTVTAINRGARRVLESVVVELDDAASVAPHDRPSTATDLRPVLQSAGLWTAFRTRPFNRVPHSDSTPRAIFVTALDTRPLAADPQVIIKPQVEAFNAGLTGLQQLTAGPVYVCTAADWDVSTDNNVRQVRFSGPHPAGLPGTHIHHLEPVGPEHSVWHINYQDVIAIGRLLSAGELSFERTVALGGSGFRQPRLVTTRIGAALDELVATELADGPETLRLISGSVLAGRRADGPTAFLGRYHMQVSAIRDETPRRLFGWLDMFSRRDDKYTFAGRLARRRHHRHLFAMSTAQHGRPAAMVPTDAFERVLPLDMLPVPLLRALLIRDTDQAQELGCLELDAEDLALCSFVCPGKNDYGSALRLNLSLIERDG